jgi:hypothetical protein
MVSSRPFPFEFYSPNKVKTEVQAKKVFTAEELSMRRAEMARRRRNLSDKRNEEVKVFISPIPTLHGH